MRVSNLFAAAKPNASTLIKIARVAFSIALVAFLVARVNVREILSHLAGIALLPLVAAAAMDLLMILVQAWRWSVLLKARGVAIGFARLVYYYMVSIFFSAFLPTSVGGDFARIVAVSTATQKRADAVASIVVERIMGFFVLLPLSLLALPFVADELVEWKIVVAAEVAGAILVLGFLVILIRPVARTCSRIMGPAFKLLSRFRVRSRLESVYDSIVVYRGSRRAIFAGVALSVLSRLLWIGACYFVGRAFALRLSLPALLLVAPIVELARMVPVSLGGIGLREAAFAVMLKQFGVEYSRGISFGIVVYAVFFLFALAGGVLYGVRSVGARRPPEGSAAQ